MMRIRALLLALSSMLFASCSKQLALSEPLAKLAEANVDRTVDIGQVTPFHWDQLVVFGQYHPKEDACKELNISSWACFWLKYPAPDDASPSVVAFMQNNKLVAIAHLPRCRVEMKLRTHGKNDRKSGTFRSSTISEGCLPGSYRLTQE